MSLPPWKPANDLERRAFSQFIIEQLDRQDETRFNSRASDENNSWSIRAARLAHEAASLGISLVPPEPRNRSGPKPADPVSNDFPDFERAALDVPRIRAIFKLHWGKRNRHDRPLAEEIAAQRWELSEKDTARLIDKFQRKG